MFIVGAYHGRGAYHELLRARDQGVRTSAGPRRWGLTLGPAGEACAEMVDTEPCVGIRGSRVSPFQNNAQLSAGLLLARPGVHLCVEERNSRHCEGSSEPRLGKEFPLLWDRRRVGPPSACLTAPAPSPARSCDGHALRLAPLRAEVEALAPPHRWGN